jgi:alpha-methylacyl-CoA racemase
LDCGALANVRVLDLSWLLPGPYCSRVLADWGAEVIKIEPPGGGDAVRFMPPLDPERGEGLLFCMLNRGKKSLTLNLKADEGPDILLRLVETADVLLDGFRPGVMARLGLEYERLAKVNPRLVYCSLTGYGPTGPYLDRAGHDLNYIGLSGLLDLTGPRDGPPAIPGAPVADVVGALWAVVGVVLALLARERTGLGQRVDASMLGGVLACLPVALTQHLGGAPVARGASYLTGGVVSYGVYETQDGQYVTLAALEPQFWAAFCRAVGRDDLLGHQFAPAVCVEPAYEELCALFRSRPRQAWVEMLSKVDACCEPVYTLDEALASAPVQALEILVNGHLVPPVRLSGQAVHGHSATEVPDLGQDTDALLRELGYDHAAVSELRKRGIV